MIRSGTAFAFTIYFAASAIAAGLISVRNYGAVGDNVTDDTAAFQKALDAYSQALGSVVSVPTGGRLATLGYPL